MANTQVSGGICLFLLSVVGLGTTPVPSKAATWTGCFGGINTGYAFSGESKKSNTIYLGGAPAEGETDRNSLSGGVGGIEVGCNRRFSNVVFGVDLDGWLQNVSGSSNGPPPFPLPETVHTSTRSTVAGAASLRLGYALGDTLIYGKGGVAATTFKHHGYIFDNSSGAALDSLSNNRTASVGYIVGAGVERALSDRWSIKVEYNYMDFGRTRQPYLVDLDYATSSPTLINGSSASRETESILKVGIVYRLFR